MSTQADNRNRSDGQTVTVELSPEDARVIVGGLMEFEQRSRDCPDPAEQEAADYYAELQETFLAALEADDVAIDRRQLIDLAGLAEQVLADGLEDQAINAAYEAAGAGANGGSAE